MNDIQSEYQVFQTKWTFSWPLNLMDLYLLRAIAERYYIRENPEFHEGKVRCLHLPYLDSKNKSFLLLPLWNWWPLSSRSDP